MSSLPVAIPGSAPEQAPPLVHDLHVLAGGRRLAIEIQAVDEVSELGPVVRVPGAAPWCLGVTNRSNRLLTVIDAGLLFAGKPGHPHELIVLRDLPVATALAVDESLGVRGPEIPADLRLDLAMLAAHPAFQPSAACSGALQP